MTVSLPSDIDLTELGRRTDMALREVGQPGLDEVDAIIGNANTDRILFVKAGALALTSMGRSDVLIKCARHSNRSDVTCNGITATEVLAGIVDCETP